jgi:hypothetical protein
VIPLEQHVTELRDHSPEDAVQVDDSVGALRHVFISFGGPPQAMGNSLRSWLRNRGLILRKLLSRARQRAGLVTEVRLNINFEFAPIDHASLFADLIAKNRRQSARRTDVDTRRRRSAR